MRTEAPNSPPSIDLSDNDSLSGAFRFILNKRLQRLNNRLPAIVIEYDRTKNEAKVQPLITLVTTSGALVSRAPISTVPVKMPGGNGYCISFPLAPGNLGWLEACDRDISLFLQSYQEEKPNTNRMFDFSDAVFTPDVMHGVTIDSEDENHLVIQKLDGSVRIALWPNKVKITALTLEVVGNITATGTITPNVPP